MIWLRIVGRPARNLYRDARTLPHLPIGEARHELLGGLGTLRAGVEGEAPNVTVTLRNDNGQCSRLFAVPPLAASAELRDESGVLFAGVVRSVDLASDAFRLAIEA